VKKFHIASLPIMQLSCLIGRLADDCEGDQVTTVDPPRRAATRQHVRVTLFAIVTILTTAMMVTHGSLVAGASSTTTTTKSGCGTSTPGSTTLSLAIDGFTRTVIVHIPRHSTDATPLALVLNLHGSGSTAFAQEELTGMNKTADHDNFIVAYPQARIPDGSGFDWNVPNAPLIGGRAVPPHAANDVKFLETLVEQLEYRYCIDAAEVYATGLSGGAREVSQMACDDSETFAAIAPVSGLRRPSPCPTTRPVSVLTFHGSADPVDPFAGRGQPYWTYSVPTAAKDWATQDQCSPTPRKTTPVATVDLTTYSKCFGGTAVELYEIIGEGHEWPGGATLPPSLTSILGPQSDAIDANSVMWSFFLSHPLH
jgi:polyhydroxybutyrate depolymerase